ncbi:hypothetical protein [Helicobacter sp. MIT 05-5294]|uniref:hypothetical protein n=1 Tax=Helicobacter sp. MIT 05-5294 TaxID=1548150 RepID=UPI00188357BC|nr:hypothetical protein [Helicobacter sp. MIT 05-5294]
MPQGARPVAITLQHYTLKLQEFQVYLLNYHRTERSNKAIQNLALKIPLSIYLSSLV